MFRKKIMCILVAAVFIFAGCDSQEVKKDTPSHSAESNILTNETEFFFYELFTAIDSFDWVSSENKPCLTPNMFANECKIFVADLNKDNMPEILLTDVYSPREASYTEVFGLLNDELKSMGGFWGYVFNGNEPIEIYENSLGEMVFISYIETSHGGNTIRFTTEVNLIDYSQKTKSIEILNNNDNLAKLIYYWCDANIELSRKFLDGEFLATDYLESTNEEYDLLFSSYTASLSKQYEIVSYNCGSLSVGNYPTGEMMGNPNFDYQYYIEHKDEPQSIDNANQTIANSIKQNILLWYNEVS